MCGFYISSFTWVLLVRLHYYPTYSTDIDHQSDCRYLIAMAGIRNDADQRRRKKRRGKVKEGGKRKDDYQSIYIILALRSLEELHEIPTNLPNIKPDKQLFILIIIWYRSALLSKMSSSSSTSPLLSVIARSLLRFIFLKENFIFWWLPSRANSLKRDERDLFFERYRIGSIRTIASNQQIMVSYHLGTSFNELKVPTYLAIMIRPR